jgi:uroporphyrin-3 C-methyltransferase
VLAAEQRDRLAEAQQSMIEALNEVSSQAPPSPREWQLAEVEYLLRIANHRILMERDVSAALRLLEAADAILLELDDFAVFQVRAALADEILALGNVRGNDVQGIYLRLEAIKGRMDDLPLDTPEYLRQATQTVPAEEVGIWQSLWAELSSYLKLRRFEDISRSLSALMEVRRGGG